MKKRVCLVILDGWGISSREEGNAIRQAYTPNFERLWLTYPHAVLEASGKAMGLPKGQMGTSEIGHMTMGSGRIMFQDLVKISQAIETGEFFKNREIVKLMNQVKKNNATLHLMGLVSDGGVHAHYAHLYALLKMAKDRGLKKVGVHVFTDGRDCKIKSGLGFVEDLSEYMKGLGVGEIVSISGRYFAMDRDHNWGRTDRAYKMMTGKRRIIKKTAVQVIKDAYEKGITDEFIKPVMIKNRQIRQADGAIFFNFRNDRPRQLLERFLSKGPKGVSWLTMTRYKPDYPVRVVYPPEELKQILGEIISRAGLKQLRVTETEKFAHLTFFFNGKQEEPFEKEDRILLDSNSDISTHDQKPQMRAEAIGEEVVQAMANKTHEAIITNLCNADMIGHTANLEAAIKGVEVIDKVLGRMENAAKQNNYDLMITADHGNAEAMIDEKTKEKLTAHTINSVPFILVSRQFKQLKQEEGSLVNIGPTILKILRLKQPSEMTGQSLV
ncbi:MAG: 2,3-bisphosphoglycerate-independent phosphoglycerate mutase [Patescibacteria group bacterium]|nr:2,3-bisphosphoglycerate-independent phosphoglycerate mutase [Patescibacteria group bacterium]